MLKVRPVASMVAAMIGSVNSNNERRPSVSIVQTAGNAPTKFRKPKTHEASSAPKREKPASEKICETMSAIEPAGD
jgi:hypothetical protein